MNTRFMEVMFSNTDEKVAAQVDSDIKTAASGTPVDTEEVRYEKTNNGNVAITDKENGEVTIAEKDPNENDTYNLIAVPNEQLEKFVHPSDDGVTPGNQVGAPDEKVENHYVPGEEADPKKVIDTAKEGACPECDEEPCEENEDEEEKEFSVTSDNVAWQKVFSYPVEFCDRLFSEVVESAETSIIGDLKIEKFADDDESVIVTSQSTGDQVKVTLKDGEMEVTELDSKNFGDNAQWCAPTDYAPLYIVGVHPYDHYIVDAQEYTEENANALAERLTEDGIEAVQIFEDQEEARSYAANLIESLGAEEVEEPVEQKEYSESIGANSIYTHSYSTCDTVFMSRLFSEQEAGISETMQAVQEAIHKGHEVEIDGAVVTPVDENSAMIDDGTEKTKATLAGSDMLLDPVEEENDEEEEEEKDFSDIYANEAETRFFSENEEMTDYMVRLFSEESDQCIIEEALEAGQEIENDTEIVTPVDDETVVVEDKESGEFTKVTILDDDRMNVHPISQEEAENLVEDIMVEDEEELVPETEKEFSEIYGDIYTNEAETRFFSENEEFTSYMERIFSEESDQDHIEEAIENGQQIENDTEIITPVDSKTAVVEDKENGEFTKAEIDGDNLDLNKISEEEADELTKDLAVEKSEEDEEKEKEEKKFSSLNRFFSEVMAQAAPAQAPVVADSNAQVQAPQEEAQPTVEDIEDKALAAVQSIRAAAEEAASQIMEAKATPAPEADPQIQEAQFSEKTFSQNNTLVSWLNNR